MKLVVRDRENIRKRVLIQAAGCKVGPLLRRLAGVGTPRSLQGRALSAVGEQIGPVIDLWKRLRDAWGANFQSGDVRRLNGAWPNRLKRTASQNDFRHGL